MSSPYDNLSSRHFWKTGVVAQSPDGIQDLYTKKFTLGNEDRIATAGSCFAQHIARHLKLSGYSVLDLEPAPPGLDARTAQEFGYGLYSARYGNIYTVRQLLQLAREARKIWTPCCAIWEKDNRYYDALRPSVEPGGLQTPELVTLHRERHIRHVNALLLKANVFIFTFGLTEAFVHRESGTVYPTAPGTIAGTYDPSIFEFKNFTFNEILEDFLQFRALLHKINPLTRFLVTVSPVPLTATASASHVLAATTYSKSVLRAVAGTLADTYDDIDYFPSYELIVSPFTKGKFFEPNLRSVLPAGVETVMRVFFGQHSLASTIPPLSSAGTSPIRPSQSDDSAKDDVICEEALLEAFAR